MAVKVYTLHDFHMPLLYGRFPMVLPAHHALSSMQPVKPCIEIMFCTLCSHALHPHNTPPQYSPTPLTPLPPTKYAPPPQLVFGITVGTILNWHPDVQYIVQLRTVLVSTAIGL